MIYNLPLLFFSVRKCLVMGAKEDDSVMIIQNITVLVHVPKFFGDGVAGSEDMCHPPYHPLDFQGKIKNFYHPTLLKTRSKRKRAK